MANNTALVKVLADNQDLTRKLAQAERKLKGFEAAAKRTKKGTTGVFGGLSQSAQNVGGPVSKVVGGLGLAQGALESIKSPAGAAALAFTGVAVAAKAMQESVSAAQKLAGATRLLQRETGLSAEAASAYVSIGSRFKLSAENLSTSFGFLSKKLRAASGDTKGASTALQLFADAGVGEATVRSGNFDVILARVADRFKAMNKPKDGPARTALAMQLFGRSGKRLLPILAQGSDGIEQLKDRMALYGLTLNQSTIDATVQLGKEQTNLKQQFEGLKIQLGVQLLPVLSRFLTAISNTVYELRAAKAPTNEFGRAIRSIGSAVAIAKAAFGPLKRTLGQFFPYVTTGFKTVKAAVTTDWRAMWNGLRSYASRQWSRVAQPFRDLKATVSRIANGFGSIGQKAGRKLKNGIVGALRGIGGSVKNALGGVLSGIRSVVNPIVDKANKIIRQINRGSKYVGVTLPEVPKMAKGGIVNRPTLAMIGEAGPEAVVPLRGQNARAARAAMGGGDNYFTINTSGPVDEQALARSIGWQLATRGLA